MVINELKIVLDSIKKLINKKIEDVKKDTIADWNQNDETASDYIKGKTHYTEMAYESIAGLKCENIPTDGSSVSTSFRLQVGQVWDVICNKADGTIDATTYKGLEVQITNNTGRNVTYLGDINKENIPFYINDSGGAIFADCDETWATEYTSVTLVGISGDKPIMTSYRYLPLGAVHRTFEGIDIEDGEFVKIVFDNVVYERPMRYISERNEYIVGNGSLLNTSIETDIYPSLDEDIPCAIIVACTDVELNRWTWMYVQPRDDEYHEFSVTRPMEVVHKLDQKFIPDTIARVSDVEESISTVEDLVNEPKRHLVLIDEINDYRYLVSIKNGNLVTYIETASVSLTTMPNKTIYIEDEKFNPKGMVITATGVDGSTRELHDYTYENVTSSNCNNFIIRYTELGNVFEISISLSMHDFSIIDFEYIGNDDGTYTLTEWKGTYNGKPSTKIIVPDNELFIIE